uniref:Helix-turn-helix domain-containing protein n=1 Tax=Bellilinea caldifistulae TaxID=360411 RepID=A0A7C4L3D9_9CHLR
MKVQELIEAVEERKRSLGWTDEALARALGVSRPLWSQIRSGKRRVTLDVVRGILRTFPDLEAQVMEYLKETA